MSSVRQAGLVAALLMAGHVPATAAVTVYGNLDLGIVKESGSSVRLDRGYNNWIGFKGAEDVGGGLTALFDIQARFNPDTGQQERPQTFWQGETTIGLKSASLGTLRLGRALSPLWRGVWAFEPWLNSGFNASLSAYQTGSYSSDGVNDVDLGYADFSRISNGIYYTSPEFSGLTVDVAGSVERPEDADARTVGASLNYVRGPFQGMLSLERNFRRDRIAFLGASYRVGKATLMGSYAHGRTADVATERSIVLAGTYAFGVNTLRLGYGRNTARDTDKIGVGLVHALSARTSLYADVFHERAAGDRTGTAVGINHTF